MPVSVVITFTARPEALDAFRRILAAVKADLPAVPGERLLPGALRSAPGPDRAIKAAMKVSAILALMLIGAVSAKEASVHVLIDFPDREDLDIAISYDEVVQLTGVKQPYFVEFWVRGAFAKAQLKFDVVKSEGGKSVTSIEGVTNDSASHWVYFVDGYRSKWHINSQTAPQPRTIRFQYEAR